MNFRTGIGYDVHKFSKDRKFILGGVEIDYDKGLEGHSDAPTKKQRTIIF